MGPREYKEIQIPVVELDRVQDDDGMENMMSPRSSGGSNIFT